MTRKQNIIWLDVETNGLDENTEKLLQVATLVTDHDLNILDEEGYTGYIYYTPKQLQELKDNSVPFVLEMHEKSGVWDAIPELGKPREVVDNELKAYWETLTESKACRLGGNSITLDRNFMRKYLPKSFDHLHYRSFDASTIAGMVEMYMGSEKMFRKDSTHEAMDDIRASVAEFKYYKELLFPNYTGVNP